MEIPDWMPPLQITYHHVGFSCKFYSMVVIILSRSMRIRFAFWSIEMLEFDTEPFMSSLIECGYILTKMITYACYHITLNFIDLSLSDISIIYFAPSV